ncbi:hypothetical protein [Micropruina sp.]|uniref:hypothetical protein n=1 Tax=Micropruina sp. TaxID=2737536 RepID=UPI0039E59674
MSTESGASTVDSESREGRGGVRFWRTSLILCSVLALLALGLGAAGVMRPPSLASASIAADRAVGTAGERLVLKSRLPVVPVEAEQVTVTPAVPFTVQTSESTVTLRFTAPLSYATEYQVAISGVHSQYTTTIADWSYSFSTPAVTLYSLIAHRGDEAQDDTVVSNDQGRTSTLITAPGIESYVATRKFLVALSNADPDSSALVAVDRTTGASVPVAMPGTGLATELNAAPDGSRFGYVFTSTDGDSSYQNSLLVADAADLASPPVEVTASGQPLAVREWQFVPGVDAVVVVTPEEQAFLVYLDGGTPPVPLGPIGQLIGFLPGSSTLMAEGGGKQLLLDLASGLNADIPNTPDPDKRTFAGRRSFRAVGDYLVEFNTFKKRTGGTGVTTRLAHVTRAGTTDLFTLPDDQGQVLNSGLSPNGQLAWAVVLDPDAPLDDLSSGASDHATTRIFDLATGEQVATVRGSLPVWAS